MEKEITSTKADTQPVGTSHSTTRSIRNHEAL
jgi:hypothetical protein